MKRFVFALSFILLAGAGCAMEPAAPSAESPVDGGSAPTEPEAADRSVTGTIVSVDLESVPVDGPAVVVIRTEAGTEETIQVRSFGLNLCAARASIADVYALKVGDRVMANGAVSEEGAIMPCESGDHYLRVVSQ